MTPKLFRQARHFNLYILLWLIALVLILYLSQSWYINNKFIGIVERKSHPVGVQEAGKIGTRAGTIRALAVTGGVITSAGIVLAATFSVLATLPLTGLFQIGLTVAVGVLIDALLVRSVLVPADKKEAKRCSL